MDDSQKPQPADALATGGPQPAKPKPPGRRWYHIAGLVLGLVVSLYLGHVLVTQWRELPPEALRLSWPAIGVSLVLCLAYEFVMVAQWRVLLRRLGVSLSFTEAIYTRCVPQLGKYLPGKVMLVVGQIYLTAEQGAGVRKATMATVYDEVLLIVAGGVVVLLSGLSAGMPALAAHRVPILIACCLGAASLHPRFVRLLLRLAARFVPRVGRPEPLSTRDTLVLVARYGATWLVLGAVSFVLARGFHPLPLRYLPDVTGIITLALIAGFVAVLTPAGLGVRDAGMSVLLSAYMPLPLAIAIALAHRVVNTTAEVLAALLGLALRPRCRALAAERAAATEGARAPAAAGSTAHDAREGPLPGGQGAMTGSGAWRDR